MRDCVLQEEAWDEEEHHISANTTVLQSHIQTYAYLTPGDLSNQRRQYLETHVKPFVYAWNKDTFAAL